jgi:AhpD family alkylhydroperoxidase
MDIRFNLFENELGARFAKRFAGAAMLVHQSSLPNSTQELVSLRASQINGCGHCIDMHTKEAAACSASVNTVDSRQAATRASLTAVSPAAAASLVCMSMQ